MPYLQQRHPPDLPREMRLGRDSRIAREEQPRAPVGHEQDDRFLVDVRLAHRPRRVRTQDIDRYPIQLHPVAPARRPPLGAITFDRAEEAEIPRIRHRLTRLEHERRIERIEHRRQAAKMIEMRVRGHDRRQLHRALASQERYHDPAAGIALRSARPSVDQQPAPSRTPQSDGITLADVQETYGEALTNRKASKGVEQRGP